MEISSRGSRMRVSRPAWKNCCQGIRNLTKYFDDYSQFPRLHIPLKTTYSRLQEHPNRSNGIGVNLNKIPSTSRLACMHVTFKLSSPIIFSKAPFYIEGIVILIRGRKPSTTRNLRRSIDPTIHLRIQVPKPTEVQV